MGYIYIAEKSKKKGEKMAKIDLKLFSSMGVAELQLPWGDPVPFRVRVQEGKWSLFTTEGNQLASIDPATLTWNGAKEAQFKVLLGKKGQDISDCIAYNLNKDGTMTLVG